MISIVAINKNNTILTDFYSRENKSVAKKTTLGVKLDELDEVPISRLKTIVDSVDEFVILLNAQFVIDSDKKLIGMDYILNNEIELDKVYSVIQNKDTLLNKDETSWQSTLRNLKLAFNYKTVSSDLAPGIATKFRLATYFCASWCMTYPPEVRDTEKYTDINKKLIKMIWEASHKVIYKYGLTNGGPIAQGHFDETIRDCILNHKRVHNMLYQELIKSHNITKQSIEDTNNIYRMEDQLRNGIGFYIEQSSPVSHVKIIYKMSKLSYKGFYDYLNRDKKILVVNIFAFDVYDIRGFKLKEMLKKSKMIEQSSFSTKRLEKMMKPRAGFVSIDTAKDEAERKSIEKDNELLIHFINNYIDEVGYNLSFTEDKKFSSGKNETYRMSIGRALLKTYDMLLDIVRQAYKNEIYCYRIESNRVEFIVDNHNIEVKRALLENLFKGFSADNIHVYVKE